jgi:hypothetical protein
MKKQQNASFPVKKLSRNDMRNLAGGANSKSANYGYWYCGTDYETYCYSSLGHCMSECSSPLICTQHRTGACV